MKKKSVGKALILAKRELKKEKREKAIEVFLLSLTLLSLSFVLTFLVTKLFITGYLAYIEGRAGYITEVEITRKFPTNYWHGIYGLALRVPNFTEQLYQNVSSGEITSQYLFFDCIEEGEVGGNEVYASTSPSIDFDNLRPATPQMVDDFLGCSGSVDCASNTFLDNMSIMVGSTNITNIPSTHTYRYDGQNEIFDLGILNDSTNLVFVTHIEDIQRGYNQEKIVNYQMLLPVPPNTTKVYYFFTDPYDECPTGGIGQNINAFVSGYVFDENGNPVNNATVNVAGYSNLTNESGFYEIGFTVVPGTYNLIATKEGYDTSFENITVNFSYYSVKKNITLHFSTPGKNETETFYVYGYVFDESGNVLSGVNISLGSSTVSSNSSGYYEINSTLTFGQHPLVAMKEGYNNYYSILNFTDDTITQNHNITMNLAYIYYTGPYTSGPYTSGPYTSPPRRTVEEARKRGEDYWISTKEIRKEIRQNTFVEDVISIYNFKSSSMALFFSLSKELQDFVSLDKSSVSIGSDASEDVKVTIYGTKPLGTYNGTIYIKGDLEREIPVTIKIVEKKFSVETLLMKLDIFNRVVRPGGKLKYKLSLQNLLKDQGYKIHLKSYIKDINSSEIYAEKERDVEILNTLTLIDELDIPKNISEGKYVLGVDATYFNYYSNVIAPFTVSKPFYLYSFFGIPLWLIFSIVSFFSFIFLNFFLYKKYRERKKRYRISLDFDTLPKPGDRVVKLGKIAETNTPAYYELDKLTTHAIVAGATGMGKSISAQVIIEEALMNNIAVIVFDPTAQWSGMLRKCEDKKMLAYYPKFGLKESDARAFKGNVRQVKNAREVIDIKKYMNPGQIQIFTMNKLEPSDIDIFVASVIRQIFRSNPEESPNLKLILVFDEVHRLLSRFGGSGEGFLQIERACREFRKWGIGVMLVSQVLSDFVGEIRANINTEVQMRTIEESDLERIRVKYGEEYLKSLVRSEVGVGMFQNAEYNKGKPYFINFRPILHNTRRLSDEELEKYNKYNDIVDDLEYQIEQLEKEKVDTFDLKMELKLVKDKIMSGNFPVVDIYLEGLKPRIEREWEKLGKKPKKREIQLVEEEEIKKAVEEAKKEREKWEKEQKKKEKKEEAKEEEKEEEKEVRPFTFDNGIMVSSLKEVKEVLPNLDEDVLNKQIKEFKDWLKGISEKLGEEVKDVKNKEELIKKIESFSKTEKNEKSKK